MTYIFKPSNIYIDLHFKNNFQQYNQRISLHRRLSGDLWADLLFLLLLCDPRNRRCVSVTVRVTPSSVLIAPCRPPAYGASPPPPGFRPEYTGPPPYESVHRDKSRWTSSAANGSGGPGFWTGLGAGGLAGYLFGSRGNTQTPYYQPTSNWHGQTSQSQWFGNDDHTTTSRRAHDNDDSGEYRSASGRA